MPIIETKTNEKYVFIKGIPRSSRITRLHTRGPVFCSLAHPKKSALVEHCLQSGHTMSWECVLAQVSELSTPLKGMGN